VIAVTDTHTWMEHPETGNRAEISNEAAEIWQARGWRPCDPPPEPDLLHDPAPPAESEPPPEPAAEEAPAVDEASESAPKSTSRARGATKE